jgi:capsular polysaccharide biosynthesis protein/Mrp family chromosome partitioning ATPase
LLQFPAESADDWDAPEKWPNAQVAVAAEALDEQPKTPTAASYHATMTEETADPRPVLLALRRRLWIVVLCAALGAMAAYVHAERGTKTYAATAELLFNGTSPVQQLLGLSASGGSQDPTTESATDVGLASLPVLTTLTANAMGSAAPANGVDVSVDAAGVSNIVDVTARARTPSLAAAVANAYSNQFIDYTRSQQTAQVNQAVTALRQQIAYEQQNGVASADLAPTRTTLAQLQTLARLQPVDVSLAQTAVAPSSPSAPRPKREGALGLLIGLVIGLIAALLLERFDPRLRSVDDLAGVTAATHALPWPAVVKPLSRKRVTAAPGRAAIDTLQLMMRPRFRHPERSGAKQVLVTSTGSRRDLQTRLAVAWALARAAALRGGGASVLYLTTDPTYGSVLEYLPAEDTTAGTAPEHRRDIRSAARPVEFSPGGLHPGVVDVMPLPGERSFLESAVAVQRLVGELSATYDYLIIDCPPPERMEGAAALIEHADAVVAVTSLYRTRRKAARDMIAELSGASAIWLIGCRPTAMPADSSSTQALERLAEQDDPAENVYDPAFD